MWYCLWDIAENQERLFHAGRIIRNALYYFYRKLLYLAKKVYIAINFKSGYQARTFLKQLEFEIG